MLILECHQWGRDLRCSAVHLPPVSWCPLQSWGGGILQGVKGICCLTSFLALLRRLGLHSKAGVQPGGSLGVMTEERTFKSYKTEGDNSLFF